MNFKRSDLLLNPKAGNTFMARQHLTLVGGLLALTLLVAGTQAEAQSVHFRYVGGRWGHGYHSGWHRYWGGPSIGFYYAPTPVYVVPGYAAPSYYTGSHFWYSNPSFGLSLNFGGGGGYYGGRYYSGGHNYGNSHYNGGHGQSFHGPGGSFNGGRQSFQGGANGQQRRSTGGHSTVAAHTVSQCVVPAGHSTVAAHTVSQRVVVVAIEAGDRDHR